MTEPTAATLDLGDLAAAAPARPQRPAKLSYAMTEALRAAAVDGWINEHAVTTNTAAALVTRRLFTGLARRDDEDYSPRGHHITEDGRDALAAVQS